MKVNKLWAALLATSFGLALAMSPAAADAQQKKGNKTAAPALVGPATATKPIAIKPDSIKWGMSMKDVSKAIDALIDQSHIEDYKKVSPGVNMRQLDAQITEEKDAFRRSRIDFGKLPVAIDSSPLKGEYSYLNKETLMTFTRKGETRHFFFIQDKLWKIIDEIKFSEKGPLGKNLQEAAVKLSQTYGVPGRVIPPNEDKGIFITTVDWKDSATHVRLIERSDAACAVAYEDAGTLANIDSLRTNKPKQEDAIDPAVAAAIRGEEPPPGPPPAADAKDKKKK